MIGTQSRRVGRLWVASRDRLHGVLALFSLAVALAVAAPSNGMAQPFDLQAYQDTLYNNFITLAFDSECSVLSAKQRNSVEGNMHRLASDFRQVFGFDRNLWDNLIFELERLYINENLTCANDLARSFAAAIAQDIDQLSSY